MRSCTAGAYKMGNVATTLITSCLVSIARVTRMKRVMNTWPIIASFILVAAAVAQESPITRIFEDVNPAMVMIKVYDAKGEYLSQATGFIVSPDGLVVTNYHVIEDATSVRLQRAGGSPLSLEGVVAVEMDSDLAILKVSAQGLPAVKLGDSGLVKAGQRVVAISSPMGLENTLSEGIVSGIRNRPEGNVIQTTAAISPGSSGGALLNMSGAVVAVTTYQKRGQQLNFAVPVNVLKGLLGKGTNPKPLAEVRRDPEAIYRLGLMFLSDGEYEEAIEYFKWVTRINPDYVDAHYQLGVAKAARTFGAGPDAIEAFNEVIKLRPGDAKAYYRLGVIFYKDRKNEKAIDAFKKVIQIDARNAKAYYWLSLAYGAIGDREAARKEYSMLKTLDRDLARELYLFID